MRAELFRDLLENRLLAIRQTLDLKRSEYAPTDDVLHNFKRGADVLGSTPERVCVGYLTKHFVSILDMVQLAQQVDADPVKVIHRINEKFGDAICYLILLEALMREAASGAVVESEPDVAPAGAPPSLETEIAGPVTLHPGTQPMQHDRCECGHLRWQHGGTLVDPKPCNVASAENRETGYCPCQQFTLRQVASPDVKREGTDTLVMPQGCPSSYPIPTDIVAEIRAWRHAPLASESAPSSPDRPEGG